MNLNTKGLCEDACGILSESASNVSEYAPAKAEDAKKACKTIPTDLKVKKVFYDMRSALRFRDPRAE